MIRLHPIPDADHTCPYCKVSIEVKGWYIPGMRNLADLECPQCERAFYGDLPAGHGLYYPMLIEQATCIVHDQHGVTWFANSLRDSYGNRVNSPVEFIVEEFRPLKQPILLNCLDKLYGHCLLKLLNAQYYLDHHPNFDLVILVPRFLRWMVPDGVAAVWMVDFPLRKGAQWNDWLAAEMKRRIELLKMCWLSVAFSHPHPEDFDIERFTEVHPFSVDEWDKRLERPSVTFIWREDRVWGMSNPYEHLQGLTQRLKHRFGRVRDQLDEQKQRVVVLANALREAFPEIDFAVVGLGRPGGLTPWITDMRTTKINERIERAWCERYAQSHIVIGVHGSNMLLPSAHAGAVVELVPKERWGNLIQDILIPAGDIQETMFRHVFLPLNSSPSVVARGSASLLRYVPFVQLNFKRPWNDHKVIQSDPWLIVKRRREIVKRLPGLLRSAGSH